MASNKSDKQPPRIEAVPLPWERLTQAQQKAACQLWALFDGHYIENAESKSRYAGIHSQRFLPAIAQKRRNQNILIDGPRGSGKTALLVTLIDAWNRTVRGEPIKEGFAGVCDTRGRVVPIALLDLRSLPNHSSLLVHISGVLRGLVKELDIACETPLLPTSPHHDDTDDAPQHAWQRFWMATAATEIQTRGRSTVLDPETFASELQESEEDRLHVGQLFGLVMDHVVAAFEKQRQRDQGRSGKDGEAPVFVIAIDDADMNPARLAECFEILESFVHPRLVYILTGDSGLFTRTLRAQFLGELRRPLGAAVELDEDERAALSQSQEARTLAAAYYTKLIPVLHRFRLPKLKPEARTEMLKDELRAIKLADGSMWTLFVRLPVLGSLLPGTLRALDDFRPELRKCVDEHAALDFLLAMKRRHVEPLRSEVDFDLDTLISPTKDPLFESQPSYEITTEPLVPRAWAYEHSIREANFGHDRTVVWRIGRYGVDHRPAGDPPQDLSATLDERISRFGLLIEYIAPHLSGLQEPFEPHLHIAHPSSSVVSTRLKLHNFGFFHARWPSPLSFHEAWRSVEFYRLWHRALAQLLGGRSLDDDRLELIGINYLQTMAHAVSATFGTDDPNVIHAPPEERRALWERVITELRQTKSPFPSMWVDTDLLVLAFPESRLAPDAAQRLLDAWEATRVRAYPSEQSGVGAMLAQANRERWRRLTRQAEERKEPATALRDLLDKHFAGHPWLERLAPIVDVDTLKGVQAALTKIPIDADFRPSWLPKNAAGYLVHRTAVLLGRSGGDPLEQIEQALNYYFEESGNTQHSLFQAWRASRPTEALMRWEDFYISFHRGVDVYRTQPVNRAPIAVADVECLLYLGAVLEPEKENDRSLAMYRLAFDVVHDQQHVRDGGGKNTWELFRTHRLEGAKITCPWPAVPWLTHVDYDVLLQAWHHICTSIETKPEDLDLVARRYIRAQVLVFEKRQVLEPSTTTLSWASLFERARFVYECEPTSAPRAQIFRRWLGSLADFARPSAALLWTNAVDALVAYLEVIAPLRSKNGRFEAFSDDEFIEADASSHPWFSLERPTTHEDRRAMARSLRHRYRGATDLFEIPPARAEATTRLRGALSELRLEEPALASVEAYLSDDLLDYCQATYSHAIARIAGALEDSSPDRTETLIAAWDAALPESPDAVRHDGRRWSIEGDYSIVPAKTDDDPSACTAEHGISYALYSGTLTSTVDEDFALVIHALLHDVYNDTTETEVRPSPIYWRLARATLGAHEYAPWRAVQWPTRYDLRLQLRSWQIDFERRRPPGNESLSARMRNFLAATAHVYRERTLFEQAAGSWREVIQEVWNARVSKQYGIAQRRRAYEAWLEEIPRLALPRAGLTHRQAADVLVRHFEITGQDPRPQLTSRLYQAREEDLGIRDQVANHPAVLLAECETDAELERAFETLRNVHELS